MNPTSVPSIARLASVAPMPTTDGTSTCPSETRSFTAEPSVTCSFAAGTDSITSPLAIVAEFTDVIPPRVKPAFSRAALASASVSPDKSGTADSDLPEDTYTSMVVPAGTFRPLGGSVLMIRPSFTESFTSATL